MALMWLPHHDLTFCGVDYRKWNAKLCWPAYQVTWK